jgi:hypothetical protein
MEDDIDNLIDNLDFSAIIQWAKTYDIPYNYESWSDDEWPVKEDALRAAVKDCILTRMSTYRKDHRK